MPCEIEKVPAKCTPAQVTPGDFVIVHGTNWTNKFIQFGQSLRFRGEDAKDTKWTHAAMIVSSDGILIEALGHGIVAASISKYWEWEYYIVHVDLPEYDRKQAVAYASYALEHNEKYGWMTIGSIGFSLLTGSKFAFGVDGEEICSGLVARSLEHGGMIFSRDASHISPCELAKQFQIP